MDTDKTSEAIPSPERGIYAASATDGEVRPNISQLTQSPTPKRAEARAPHPCLSESIRGIIVLCPFQAAEFRMNQCRTGSVDFEVRRRREPQPFDQIKSPALATAWPQP